MRGPHSLTEPRRNHEHLESGAGAEPHHRNPPQNARDRDPGGHGRQESGAALDDAHKMLCRRQPSAPMQQP